MFFPFLAGFALPSIGTYQVLVPYQVFHSMVRLYTLWLIDSIFIRLIHSSSILLSQLSTFKTHKKQLFSLNRIFHSIESILLTPRTMTTRTNNHNTNRSNNRCRSNRRRSRSRNPSLSCERCNQRRTRNMGECANYVQMAQRDLDGVIAIAQSELRSLGELLTYFILKTFKKQ